MCVFCIPVFLPGPARHAVLLTPSTPLRPSFPYFFFSNSFACHRSENSTVSPTIATLPKTHVCNPFPCHTSETPPGCRSQHSIASPYPLFNSAPPVLLPILCFDFHFRPLHLSPFFSTSSPLSSTTAISQLFSNQLVAHSFHHDGGSVYPPDRDFLSPIPLGPTIPFSSNLLPRAPQ